MCIMYNEWFDKGCEEIGRDLPRALNSFTLAVRGAPEEELDGLCSDINEVIIRYLSEHRPTMSELDGFRELSQAVSDITLCEIILIAEMLKQGPVDSDPERAYSLFEGEFKLTPLGLFCSKDPEEFEDVFIKLLNRADETGYCLKETDYSERLKVLKQSVEQLLDAFDEETSQLDPDDLLEIIEHLEADRGCVLQDSLKKYFQSIILEIDGDEVNTSSMKETQKRLLRVFIDRFFGH